MPKEVHLQYYAVLREQRGLSTETVSTSVETARELYVELQNKHNLSLPVSLLKVAVNEEFCDWDAPIKSGDTVVFIPPVAGG